MKSMAHASKRTFGGLEGPFARGSRRLLSTSRRSRAGRLFGVGLTFSGRDQAPQAALDVRAPRARAGAVALVGGNQARVGEADLGLVALPGDVEGHARAVPLALVLDEIEVAVQDEPDDSLSRNQLRDLLLAVVDVLVPVGELTPELVGGAFDVSGPPSAHVGDGTEGLFRGLVDRKRGREVLICL